MFGRTVELGGIRRNTAANLERFLLTEFQNLFHVLSIAQMRQINIDMVLIMTVNPGFGGQKFIPEMVQKIKDLREIDKNIDIEVDGGINNETAKLVKEAGANILVAGSYIFSGNYKEKIESLK